MADITSLTALSAPSTDDIIYIVDDPGGTPADRKITVANLFASPPAIGGTTAAAITGTSLTLSDGAARTITGPTNENLVINARPNATNEGLLLQIGGTEYARLSQSGNFILGTTATTANAQLYATKDFSNASGTDIPAYFNYKQTVLTAGGIEALRGDAQGTHTSGTVASLKGVRGRVLVSGAGGTTTNAYGVHADIAVTAGTVTSAFGLYSAAFNSTGTITTGYACYLGATNADTTGYGLYQAAAADVNYMAGALRIGTTSATTAAGEVLRAHRAVGGLGDATAWLTSGDGSATVLGFGNATTGSDTTDGFRVGISGGELATLWNYESTAMQFATANTERARIAADCAAIGIGTTSISTWSATYAALDFGEATLMSGASDNKVWLLSNAYLNTGGLWKYVAGSGVAGDEAARFVMHDGFFEWATAAAGSTDGTISWSEKMRLTNAGLLGIGTAAPDGTLHVHTATAGTWAPPTYADDLVVENNTTGGITIATPDAQTGRLAFSTPTTTTAYGAICQWNYGSGTWEFITNKVGASLLFKSDANVLNLTLSGAAGSELAVFENNVLLGGSTDVTTGKNCLALFTGTAPSAVAADSLALYSSDLSAGNTIPSIWTEGSGIYSAGTPAAATGSIAIRVNGTVYHFTVSTTAAS